MPCSFGYRPGTGAHQAVKEQSAVLRSRTYKKVVEADIKGFFDNINHDLLLDMLRMRIDDKPFLKLIRKWLLAGILDTDGMVLHPVTGTPQGGLVSPLLKVPDALFEEVVKAHCKGKVYLCRYADDFVCAFEVEGDAQRFYGYWNHYGLRGNYESLNDYFYHITRILLKRLNRRSQHKSYTWTSFGELFKDFPLIKPRICHSF